MTLSAWIRSSLLIIVAFAFAACGGGGGGGSNGVSVNTTAISFEAEVNASIPDAKNYSITWSNSDVASVLVGVPPSDIIPTWIDIGLIGSSSPLTLQVGVNTTNLTSGTYTMTLRVVSVNSSGGIINIVDIPVDYTVHQAVTLAPDNLVFNSVEGVAAASQNINVTSLTFTPVLTANDNVGWLDTSVSGTTVTVTPNANAEGLAVGDHIASVSVQYTLGSLITRNIPVTYTVNPALAGPASINITVDGSTVLADLQGITQSILSNRTTSINWDASENQDWLILNTTSGNTSAIDNLSINIDDAVLATLANGLHQTSITISSTDANVTDLVLPVNLTVNLPEVHYVAPYVAYTATVGSDYVIIRGEGLTNYSPAVVFGGNVAGAVTVISDSELRVTPPSLTVGTYTVEVENALGFVRQTKDLVVKDAPNYADATLAVDFGFMERILYDAEREVLFTAQCYFCTVSGSNTYLSNVLKFSYNSTDGVWEYTAFPYTELFDIAMTPDGQHLVVLTSNTLLLVNPDTMVTEETIFLPVTVGGTANQLGVLNNGYIIIRSILQAYSLIDQDFVFLNTNMGGTIGIVTSLDGSRAVYGFADNSGSLPFRYFDASSNTEVTTPAYYYFTKPSYSLHAERLFTGGYILDSGFNVYDTLSASSGVGVISPDGQMAYEFDYNTTTIRKFDLSGSSASELTSVAIADPYLARLGISQDGSLLFVVGHSQFIVLNVP